MIRSLKPPLPTILSVPAICVFLLITFPLFFQFPHRPFHSQLSSLGPGHYFKYFFCYPTLPPSPPGSSYNPPAFLLSFEEKPQCSRIPQLSSPTGSTSFPTFRENFTKPTVLSMSALEYLSCEDSPPARPKSQIMAGATSIPTKPSQFKLQSKFKSLHSDSDFLTQESYNSYLVLTSTPPTQALSSLQNSLISIIWTKLVILGFFPPPNPQSSSKVFSLISPAHTSPLSSTNLDKNLPWIATFWLRSIPANPLPSVQASNSVPVSHCFSSVPEFPNNKGNHHEEIPQIIHLWGGESSQRPASSEIDLIPEKTDSFISTLHQPSNLPWKVPKTKIKTHHQDPSNLFPTSSSTWPSKIFYVSDKLASSRRTTSRVLEVQSRFSRPGFPKPTRNGRSLRRAFQPPYMGLTEPIVIGSTLLFLLTLSYAIMAPPFPPCDCYCRVHAPAPGSNGGPI